MKEVRRVIVLATTLVFVAAGLIVGAAPAMALAGVTVPDVDFGTVQYDTVPTKVVSITNSSGQALRVYSYSTNDAQFTVSGYPTGVPSSSQCGSVGNIGSGGTCSLSVALTPGGYGSRQATLSVDFRRASDGATFGTATSSLSASVVTGSLQIPTIDFGTVNVGQSFTRVLELVNTGMGQLRFRGYAFNDAQFTTSAYPSGVPSSSQCGSSSGIAPGGRCSIAVTFGPSAGGTRSAVLTVETAAGTFTAPATGVGYRSGYTMVSANGRVYPFGSVPKLGDPSGSLGSATALKFEPTASGGGYWILSSAGVVYGYGDGKALGNVNLGALDPGEQVASMSGTPSASGYWVFTNRGRALPFGDAKFFGDMSRTRLNGPVLGSVATPSGNGYYMVASDGGIFAFGDAGFRGSMGGRRLNAPVGAVVPNADNTGYWLVASDGGIFAFGAPFLGSMGASRLNRPVVGMIRYGNGYLMVASDGGIFNFSNREFLGSLGSNPPSSPVVSVGAVY